jgi:hypothetical protein
MPMASQSVSHELDSALNPTLAYCRMPQITQFTHPTFPAFADQREDQAIQICEVYVNAGAPNGCSFSPFGRRLQKRLMHF